MAKRKVKTLSLEDKVKLINDIDAKACKKSEIAKKYGIPCSTLSTIYKNRDRILKFARAGTEPGRKRLKNGKFPQLEEEVWKWILSSSGHSSTMSGTMIRKRAQWLADQQGYQGFQASVGWLDKFRARHNLKTVRKRIVLPKDASSLPSDQSEEFILSGNSTEDDVPQEPPPHHLIPDTEIKQEVILPDENDNSASMHSEFCTGRPVPSGLFARREVVNPNGTTENQPADEPRGSSESVVPTRVNATPSAISTPKREWTNPTRADIARENGSANLNRCNHHTTDESQNSASLLSEFLPHFPVAPGLFAIEEIMRPSFNGTAENQPANEPRAGAESVDPVYSNATPSDNSTHRCGHESTNLSGPSSDSVPENANANPTSDRSTCRRKDQLECFGSYIVSKLKLMDARTRLVVQKVISDTIFVAEMRSLRA